MGHGTKNILWYLVVLSYFDIVVEFDFDIVVEFDFDIVVDIILKARETNGRA